MTDRQTDRDRIEKVEWISKAKYVRAGEREERNRKQRERKEKTNSRD